jgi:DNA-binding response OmpR family regulator
MKPKILVVDDEPDVIELVAFNLRSAGFDITSAENGEEALRKARLCAPDLVILDLMLPEVDGIDVCKMMRRDPVTAKVPIIMLTAKAAEIDRVLGLEMGADDYVTKPFSPRELVLRVKNLVKRANPDSPAAERYQVGELIVDLPRHEVWVGNELISLTATEFNLLTVLVQRRGRVQSRDQLLQDVWNYERVVDTRTVDTHMRRLREKLGRAARFLETVRNVGYRFVDE